MNIRRKTLFLTGATGLVGSYLLKIFVENGHKVFCLARKKEGKNAQDRIMEVLDFWSEKKGERNFNNLVVLEGDIRNKDLGLDYKTKDILKNEVEEIFHCAAITEFNASFEILQSVNIEGTRNILELGSNFNKKGKLKKINYLSSVYICGDYEGIFTENTFDVGQKFTIPYEQSKFEAEKLVYKYRKRNIWINIFRLPAIVGEAKTGKILSFEQAFYQGLRILNSEIFDSLPCNNSYLDIVYIDELCDSIYRVMLKCNQKNICYNLFCLKALSIERMLTLASSFLNIKKPTFISYKNFIKRDSTFVKNKLLTHNYFFLSARNTKFSSSLTNERLRKYGFTFSEHNKNRLLRLLKYAVSVGYLKKKC